MLAPARFQIRLLHDCVDHCKDKEHTQMLAVLLPHAHGHSQRSHAEQLCANAPRHALTKAAHAQWLRLSPTNQCQSATHARAAIAPDVVRSACALCTNRALLRQRGQQYVLRATV